MCTDFVCQVKCTISWLNRGLRVYLDLYVLDFPKSTSKYLLSTKVVRKHGSRCFTAMCYLRIQSFWKEIFWAAQSSKFIYKHSITVGTRETIGGFPFARSFWMWVFWKGELLFSSVEQVTLIHVHWLRLSSKMHLILAR